ncbi:photosystem II biogenesis protein Psp29 [Kovacikia minuta]|uniref:photosystem II biogenesis protein Psp29 n=1 Tax=Kovacikia minuta TaxID=2931930 RepID=UPI0020C788B6
MVEMHLLAVNADFRYDPIYALGVVTAFNRFMQGYRPEADITSIFDGLCKALEDDPNRYRHDAERLGAIANRLSQQELVSWLEQSSPIADAADLQESVRTIAHNPQFKYSRLFAIGVYTLLELADPELVKDETQRTEALKKICATLNLPEEKFQKDLELYRSNLEKMAQARIVMEDALQAERKKREEREKAKAAAASTPPSDTPESTGETASGS